MTVTGTNIFQSQSAADAYYADYGYTPRDVYRKIADGEIRICSKPDGRGYWNTERRWVSID